MDPTLRLSSEITENERISSFINFHWKEGLEFEEVKLFNLTECPETGKSTPWDFEFAFNYLNNHTLCDWTI